LLLLLSGGFAFICVAGHEVKQAMVVAEEQ